MSCCSAPPPPPPPPHLNSCTTASIELDFSLPSYHQARAAATIGLRKLEELGVPTERPDDYFAEMIKGDDHMRKVMGVVLLEGELCL